MNYLRGAFNAASQYYKDLPPINPSTLTGAIDVIVIEKPAENGGTELACSPFHVRFGKWQVLRPGEKKVNVLVNGHSIPFDMKIGDAGEAFFVFETDEDVPDELITSPLLQATNVDQSNYQTDASAEIVGVKDRQGKEAKPTQGGKGEEAAEPDFLDLDASIGESKSSTLNGKISPDVAVMNTPDGSSGLADARIHASTLESKDSSGPQDMSPNGTSIPFLADAHRVDTAVANTTKDHELNKVDSLVDSALMREFSAPSVPRMNGSINRPRYDVGFHEGAGDDVLTSVDERDAQPPEVTYRHDVVLDASGYHSKEASDQTIRASDDTGSSQGSIQSALPSNIIVTPDASRTPSPVYLGDMSAPRMNRATSEPPEYGTSSPTPPEYSWEWGAFPQRSSHKQKFSAEDSDMPRHPRFSPPLLDSVGETFPPSSSRARSPIPEAAFVDGGRLEGDLEDPYRIWLDFEGQKLGFEVSLCGETVYGEEAVENARHFDRDRVTFTRLLEDSNVVHDRNLVVRWDDEYMSRQDNSPLMSALANWRLRTLSPPTSPRPYLSESQNGRPTSIKAPRPSPWSRWWSRNRTVVDVKETVSNERVTASAQGLYHAKRPPLDHMPAASLDAVPPASQSTATMPSSSVPFPSGPPGEGKRRKYAKTLRLTSDQLKALNLNKGANVITFSLSASGQIACTARIFVWNATDHIVVSDIDGTITKSDALGHVFTLIGRDWTHLGVAKLYTDIHRNGYKVMYLTSRAIGQADSTRDYLRGINQNNYQLPEGPVVMSPDRLLTSLHREVIMRKPEVFKMACLRDIQRLFGKTSHKPFYAGFGNRITDALSYRSVNIPSAKIFTIDSSGEVKMELLELAGYKSSYIHMTDLVDQMFPPINRTSAPEYTDFNYWRTPVQEYELPEALTAPPSPTLSASARSDTAFSRLRQFSLGRSTSRGLPEGSSSSTPANGSAYQGNGHVRAVASLDHLGSNYLNERGAHVNGKGKNWDVGPRGAHRMHFSSGELEFEDEDIRTRRRRKGSDSDNMPGSLPGSMEDRIWGMRDPRWSKDRDAEEAEDNETGEDELEESEEDEIENEDDAEEAAEEAFDDDLLATGEMETVPFL